MISKLQNMAIHWLPFFEQHLWLYPEKLDAKECYVYGTGYESWGVWAHLNAALYLAESLSWDQKLFSQSKSKFANYDERKMVALGMLRYALAYHTTGEFEGAGGTRWGSEKKEIKAKEGYNNWHSPLWVAFLAEVFFTLEPMLTADLKARFHKAVIHDANAQIHLDESNFDGEAEEDTKASHPESNAWKASLLLLARQLDPHHKNVTLWQSLENRLWVSSFATPNDLTNEQTINGKAISQLAIGNHITNSLNVVHHGFLHPCYMIFPLLSRMQAARFSSKFSSEYPQEASFRENEVMARLTPFIMGGRVIYPAGQDWPRWSYGQFYLLPILIHKSHNLGQDYTTEIKGLIQTRETDSKNSQDKSFVIHRFGNLLKESAWVAHRFESDAAASLIQAIQILKQPSLNLNIPKAKANDICFEPLAKTVYLKRDDSFFSISARACEGPGQLTIVNTKNPHLLEWRNNGCPQATRLHGTSTIKKDSIENDSLKTLGESAIAGYFEMVHIKEGYKKPSLKLTVNAAVLPDEDTMLVRQKIISNCFTAAKDLKMHVWRFTQSPHNQWKRTVTFEKGAIDISADQIIDQEIKSNWICIDQSLYLTLPQNQVQQNWHITQGNHHEDKTGITWFEVFVQIPFDSEKRIPPHQTLADSSIIVSLDKKHHTAQTILDPKTTIFKLSNNTTWQLTEAPTLTKK